MSATAHSQASARPCARHDQASCTATTRRCVRLRRARRRRVWLQRGNEHTRLQSRQGPAPQRRPLYPPCLARDGPARSRREGRCRWQQRKQEELHPGVEKKRQKRKRKKRIWSWLPRIESVISTLAISVSQQWVLVPYDTVSQVPGPRFLLACRGCGRPPSCAQGP